MALDDDAQFRAQFAESELVEWKEGLSGKKLQEAIVAFSNAQGGVIQIGVRNDGSIAGRPLDNNTEMTLHNIINGVRTRASTRCTNWWWVRRRFRSCPSRSEQRALLSCRTARC